MRHSPRTPCRRMKKASVLTKSRTLSKDGGITSSVVPPWFTLPSQAKPRCCGSHCCLQPDAVTGASRCRLSAPAPRPHGSETIFHFLFPALFHRPGSLVRINAKAYSSLHSHFCDIAFILIPSAGFVNTFQRSFLVGNCAFAAQNGAFGQNIRKMRQKRKCLWKNCRKKLAMPLQTCYD